MSQIAVTRRKFLGGIIKPTVPQPLRPPWVGDEGLARCTSCGDCVTACPEKIIFIGAGGLPEVNFSDTGCTLCGDCASACPEDVFAVDEMPAFASVVSVSAGCLLKTGVSCRLCTDFCDVDALSFDMSVRPIGALSVVTEDCTGCGMCVGACPVDAITVGKIPEGIRN